MTFDRKSLCEPPQHNHISETHTDRTASLTLTHTQIQAPTHTYKTHCPKYSVMHRSNQWIHTWQENIPQQMHLLSAVRYKTEMKRQEESRFKGFTFFCLFLTKLNCSFVQVWQ